jgi:hypothetical protein
MFLVVPCTLLEAVEEEPMVEMKRQEELVEVAKEAQAPQQATHLWQELLTQVGEVEAIKVPQAELVL